MRILIFWWYSNQLEVTPTVYTGTILIFILFAIICAF